MSVGPERIARVLLVSADQGVVGCLPPLAVATPWWQDVEPVTAAVRANFGLTPVILRILATERPSPPGGLVTYLAEVENGEGVGSVEPWSEPLREEPLRQSFARPGGPAGDLAWAVDTATQVGQRVAGRPVQVRTWHLSSVWRLPGVRENFWLKVTPPFAAPEGTLLSCLTGGPVPQVVAHSDRRCLFREVGGKDLYDASRDQLVQMVDLLLDLQSRWGSSVDELRRAGVRDQDEAALTRAITGVIERHRRALPGGTVETLDRFVASLPDRLSALAACGLPEGLVHGDFHPGNVRGSDERLTLIDWSDACLGHPLLDLPPFLGRIRRRDRDAVRAHWLDRWRSIHPGSAPERAAELIAPIVAARQAAVYQSFIDQIEPAEQAYHDGDPQTWLRRTAVILGMAH